MDKDKWCLNGLSKINSRSGPGSGAQGTLAMTSVANMTVGLASLCKKIE